MIRAVIADDSATARQLLRAILEEEGDIRVIAEARDGVEAVTTVDEMRPDIVLMDVHMPRADGLHATKEIMMRAPTPIVIVSSMAQRDVDLSLSATHAGALLALPKPAGPSSERHAEEARELRQMVRAMAGVKVVRRWASGSETLRRATPRPRSAPAHADIVCMAASTGGPAALRRVLVDLPLGFPAPILIVQHIARGFTAGFAEWLGSACALPVVVATSGERMRPGTVYVAPDDRHLGVRADGGIFTSAAEPISGFRPSATFLFATAGAAYGERMVGVVLTGMGSDGAEGLEAAHRAGAYVLAQDEQSSVVFGMAGEAVRLGAVDAVVPLDVIAPRLNDIIMKDRNES